jgi:DNA-binding beta-propeller fold protein YncE
MKKLCLLLIITLAMFSDRSLGANKDLPLRLLQTIPLPNLKSGDFDHFAVDFEHNRLFLTAEENNAVEVFDLRTNKRIHTIRDVDTPHSLLYLADSNQLLVINGGDGAVKFFDVTTYDVIATVNVSLGADSSVYEPARHLLYIACGGEDAKMDSSLISIIDTSTRKHVGDIKVDSTNIEGMAIELNGPRLFVNIRDRSLIGVVDRERRTVIATWPLGGVKGNTPIALDEANHRLFVAGRKPATFLVLDTDSGKIVSSLPTAEITDDMLFDSESKRIYIACSDFAVVYAQVDADHYKELGRAPTGFRGKTAILVSPLQRYYVAVPRHGNKLAGVRVYQVQ